MSATVQADRVAGPSIHFEDLLAAPRVARSLTIACAALAAAMAAGALLLALAGAAGGQIMQGVSLGGVEVGGMSEAQARAEIQRYWSAYAARPIVLQAPEAPLSVTPAEAGLTLDIEGTIARASAIGRNGSPWSDSQARARALLRGVEVPLALNLDPVAAERMLERVAPSVVRGPVDARLEFAAGVSPAVAPDAPGIAIDGAGTMAAFAATASRMESYPVPVVLQTLPAAVTAAVLVAARENAAPLVAAPLVLRAGDQAWHLPAAGVARLLSGRAGGALAIDRAAIVAVVRSIASSVDQPLADASVFVGDDGRLAATPGGSGLVIDVNASADAIEQAILGAAGGVDLAFTAATPRIPNAIAEAAAERGNALLDAGMALRWEGGGATLGRNDLLRALTISVDPASADPFTFGLDLDAVRDTLSGIAGDIDQPMVNARFRLVDGQVVAAVPDKVGRVLDVDAGARQVVAAFGAGEPVDLDVSVERPVWSAADLASITLGNDILGEGGTYYGESSEPRRRNIELAGSLVSGWLVPPGEEFSYARTIGEVDAAAGFETGFGIVEQDGAFATAPVIGGGICQVSTTIFQAAFWAGLPITERYQHPYFLPSYSGPPTGLPGLDAMVNIDPVWTLDMKFRNTTGDWIAVIVIPDGQNLWTRIVGVDPGWTVDVTEPLITNRVTPDPEMVYVDSPELPEGQEMVIERAADGFDVSLTRTVYGASGEVIDALTLESKFTPSLNRTLRGVGPQ
ncbi:MAG: VanW family protein [Chloroflexota bacterium]